MTAEAIHLELFGIPSDESEKGPGISSPSEDTFTTDIAVEQPVRQEFIRSNSAPSTTHIYSLDDEIEKIELSSFDRYQNMSILEREAYDFEQALLQSQTQQKLVEQDMFQQQQRQQQHEFGDDEMTAEEMAAIEQAMKESMLESDARDEDVNLISERRQFYLDADFQTLEESVASRFRLLRSSDKIKSENVPLKDSVLNNKGVGNETDIGNGGGDRDGEKAKTEEKKTEEDEQVPYVQPIPKDGNCIPRSVLVSGGYDASDFAVTNLRESVVEYMKSNRDRFVTLAEQGSTSVKQIDRNIDDESKKAENDNKNEDDNGNDIAVDGGLKRRKTKRISQLAGFTTASITAPKHETSPEQQSEEVMKNEVCEPLSKENGRSEEDLKEEKKNHEEEYRIARQEEELKQAVEKRWQARLLNMRVNGTFFEEPEMQALADLTQRPVILDALLSHNASVERHLFEPIIVASSPRSLLPSPVSLTIPTTKSTEEEVVEERKKEKEDLDSKKTIKTKSIKIDPKLKGKPSSPRNSGATSLSPKLNKPTSPRSSSGNTKKKPSSPRTPKEVNPVKGFPRTNTSTNKSKTTMKNTVSKTNTNGKKEIVKPTDNEDDGKKVTSSDGSDDQKNTKKEHEEEKSYNSQNQSNETTHRKSIHLLLMMGAATAPHCEPVMLKLPSTPITEISTAPPESLIETAVAVADSSIAPITVAVAVAAPPAMPITPQIPQIPLLSIEELLTPPSPVVVESDTAPVPPSSTSKTSTSSSAVSSSPNSEASKSGQKKKLSDTMKSSTTQKSKTTPKRNASNSRVGRSTTPVRKTNSNLKTTATTSSSSRASGKTTTTSLSRVKMDPRIKDTNVRSKSTGFVRSKSLSDRVALNEPIRKFPVSKSTSEKETNPVVGAGTKQVGIETKKIVDTGTKQVGKETKKTVDTGTKQVEKGTKKTVDTGTKQVEKETKKTVDTGTKQVEKGTKKTVDTGTKSVKETKKTVGAGTKSVKETKPVGTRTKQPEKETKKTVDTGTKQPGKETKKTVDTSTKQVGKETKKTVDTGTKQVGKETKKTVDTGTKQPGKETHLADEAKKSKTNEIVAAEKEAQPPPSPLTIAEDAKKHAKPAQSDEPEIGAVEKEAQPPPSTPLSITEDAKNHAKPAQSDAPEIVVEKEAQPPPSTPLTITEDAKNHAKPAQSDAPEIVAVEKEAQPPPSTIAEDVKNHTKPAQSDAPEIAKHSESSIDTTYF